MHTVRLLCACRHARVAGEGGVGSSFCVIQGKENDLTRGEVVVDETYGGAYRSTSQNGANIRLVYSFRTTLYFNENNF